MRAGRLRHRIDIEHLVTGSPNYTPSGELSQTWVVLHNNVPAEWITLSGNALFAAQAHDSEVKGIWLIRWHEGVTDLMRIVDRDLIYNILWVPPYDRHGKRNEMSLECSEGVNSG